MFKQLTIIALFAALGSSARAQDGALLDLLVKKKVINAQEAEDVRADLIKEQAATSAGKLNVDSWVKEMKIGGDLRLRYQYDSRDFQVDPAEVGARGANHDKDRSPTGAQNSRWRFRLRLYDEFKLNDNWFGGIALATTPAADGANQTYGNGFGKYGIFISKAYLGWNASDWATVVAGKQANPFYTTDLVWDPDINPDGLTESVKFHKLFAGRASEGYSKDGKSVVATKPPELPWELTLNLAQYIFSDNLENGAINSEAGFTDNDLADDAYIFEGQLVGSYKFPKAKVTFAPGIMLFNSAALFGLANDNLFQDGTAMPASAVARNTSFTGATRKETIITAPGDVTFKLGIIPAKFYWDFAWNTQGRGRFDDIYGVVRPLPAKANANPNEIRYDSLHEASDDIAWLVGVKVGDNKKRGDASLNVNWRQTGLTSVEPNLNDNDFALGELNTRGLKTELTYNLTDFATFGVSYFYAWNLRDNFIGATGPANLGPGTSGGVGDANTVQVLFVDLVVKF